MRVTNGIPLGCLLLSGWHRKLRPNHEGPRAGINFNDGFGGGNVVKGAVLFSPEQPSSPPNNQCCESFSALTRSLSPPPLRPPVPHITQRVGGWP
jgi:hypothetical protein